MRARTIHRARLAAAAGALIACAAVAQTPRPIAAFDIDPQTINRYTQAEILLLCTVDHTVQGPTAPSNPPVHKTSLTLAIEHVYRGRIDRERKFQAMHSMRGGERPKFDKADKVIVVAEVERRAGKVLHTRAVHVDIATPGRIEQAQLASQLPVGWKVDARGTLTCPWAAIEGYDLPQVMTRIRSCARTGRQAFLAGPIALSVEPVIVPEQQVRWANPDGDGAFRITVTNPTDEPLGVPALLKSGETILWDQSIVIVCEGRTYTLPGAGVPPDDVGPITLEPGESVSTTMNILTLDGPDWPRGASRLTFTFALGEHATSHSFYYMSDHHDPLRRAARDH
jgi:hypothetical protein